MNIDIRELKPALLNDYLFFFDNITFKENPHWSKCYCYSFHFTGPDEEWTKTNNRIAIQKLITQEKMKGYLAYFNNTPVAWCNVNDRISFQRLKRTYELPKNGKKRIASIVCFLVHPDFRGKGISKMLLKRIIDDYEKYSYDLLEAYPARNERSCEKNYKGPLSIFESNGFDKVATHEGYFIMQKKLK